jgi:hypothetical protein
MTGEERRESRESRKTIFKTEEHPMGLVARMACAALSIAFAFEFGCGNPASSSPGPGDNPGPIGPSDSGGSSGQSSGASGSGSSGSGTSSGQVPSSSGASASDDASAPAGGGVPHSDAAAGEGGTSTGSFPAITGDAGAPGPYATSVKSGAGPNGDGTVYYPTSFGPDGLKNPIFVWDPGSGIQGTMYASLLTELASQGFAAYACNASSTAGTEVKDGIDWMVAQNTTQGSIFFGKLDTTKIAAGGHSLGSLAVFANAADTRLTTTIHISGGTMDSAHAAVANLHGSTLYLCGKTESGSDNGLTSGDLAAPNCAGDYAVTKVPVFYGQNTSPGDPGSHAFGWESDFGAFTAWLRWYLMGDTTQKGMFLGASCGLCASPWIPMSKNF